MRFVIMAGGTGKRFWPLSRRKVPKQYLDITGPKPMIVETFERIRPMADQDGVYVVINKLHQDLTAKLFEGSGVRILAEPRGRNTAACMGLACLYLEAGDAGAPAAFLPADHHIGDAGAFRTLLGAAERIAGTGCIVTLGIEPSRPETGYGYIRRGSALENAGGLDAYEVEAFVEKPSRAAAVSYLESGRYYWNSGMFIAKPSAILCEIEQHIPALYEGLRRLPNPLETDAVAFERKLASVYEEIPAVSIDHGIMEKTSRPIGVLPAKFEWTDIGSWEALFEHHRRQEDARGNVSEGRAVLEDTVRSFVLSKGGRIVVCLGLEDCLIVDTGDAVLVADLKSSQAVKDLLSRLEALGMAEVL